MTIDYENNPSFCVLPWVHRLIDNDGGMKDCCQVPRAYGHVSNWEESWNSDRIKEMRRKMVAGEKIDACRHCYYKEANDRRSIRQSSNRQYMPMEGITERVERSIENGYHVDENPIFLEFRFGSMCNLKCKMCTGHYSTTIRKDAKQLQKMDPEGFDKHMSDELHFMDMPQDWYLNPETMAKVMALIPDMIEIHYSGGEPTLTDEYLNFLRLCVDSGYAKDITMVVTTNTTNVNQELVDLMKQFKSVLISMSVDGIEGNYEYIRVPANWEKVRENMGKLIGIAESQKIKVAINMVVQLHNVMYLPEIMEEFIRLYKEHGSTDDLWCYHVNLVSILGPQILRLDMAPEHIRMIALSRLRRWREANMDDLTAYSTLESWMMVENLLARSNSPDDLPTNTSQMILDYTRFIDQNKPKHQLRDKLPELYQLLIQDT